MNDYEIRAKYDLSLFKEVDRFELVVDNDKLMSDEELCRAVYGTDDDEELQELVTRDDNFFWVAIRDYGNRHLNGAVVEQLENSDHEVLWHVEHTLYMTDADSGLRFDLYFDHKPDEDDVIKAICLAEGITKDLTL